MGKGKVNLTSDLYVYFKISKSLGPAVHTFIILACQSLKREDGEFEEKTAFRRKFKASWEYIVRWYLNK